MFRFTSNLRLLAACAALALIAAPAAAIPGAKGGGRHKSGKSTDPLETAIKDLKEAEKDLGSKEGSNASKLTHSAESIVSDQLQQSRQARDRAMDNSNSTKEQRDHLKARVKSLDGAVKDIKTAEKGIAAKKSDDAKTAIQSAITALEGLTGTGEKKKK